MERAARLERNLRLYPAFQIAANLHFWLPVFFLYFNSLFTLGEVLRLEALYYLSVVALEVPSGYFSDRCGRRRTLLISCAAGAASGAIFAASASYAWFCAAQVLFAVFMAFLSGSDTSLHYDTLKALGREHEVLKLEARAHSGKFLAGALSALAAGAAALYDLRVAYVLSALAFFAAGVIVWLFEEPPRTGEAVELTMARQIRACAAKLDDRLLAWLFLWYVGMTIFEHVPYEFFQPYLGLVYGTQALALVAGGHLAATNLVSAAIARCAPRAGERWGVKSALLGGFLIETALIALMALWVHPLVVLLLLARNAPHALSVPIKNAAIHARLDSGLRATYLSLQSLAGRLANGLALLAVSGLADLRAVLAAFAVLAAVWFAGLGAKRAA